MESPACFWRDTSNTIIIIIMSHAMPLKKGNFVDVEKRNLEYYHLQNKTTEGSLLWAETLQVVGYI